MSYFDGFYVFLQLSVVLAYLQNTISAMSLPLKRIAVVGGGAAGYFSGIEAAQVLKAKFGQNRYEVVIFEAGRTPLSKVLISGGGRCNVMHDPRKGSRVISKGYPRGNKELLGPLSAKFGPDETYYWFTSKGQKSIDVDYFIIKVLFQKVTLFILGVELKVEEDGRVFPTTDRAESIINALENEAIANDVKVYSSTQVLSINCLHKPVSVAAGDNFTNNKQPLFTIKYRKARVREVTTRSSIDKNDDYVLMGDSSSDTESSESVDKDDTTPTDEYLCDRIIFATGSNRGGYMMLEKLGHTINPPLPSLFSFKVKDELLTALSGLPITNAQIKLILNKEQKLKCQSILAGPGGKNIASSLEQTGPVMITHQGLSGPGILRLSAYGAKILATLNYQTEIEINWLPGISSTDLVDHLNMQRLRNANKLVSSWFPPIRVSDTNDMISNADEDKSWSSVTDIIISSSSDTTLSSSSLSPPLSPPLSASNNHVSRTAATTVSKQSTTINGPIASSRKQMPSTYSVNSKSLNNDNEPVLTQGQASIPRRLWKYILTKAGVDSGDIENNSNENKGIIPKQKNVPPVVPRNPGGSLGITPSINTVSEGLKWGSISKTQIQAIADQILKQRHFVTGRFV